MYDWFNREEVIEASFTYLPSFNYVRNLIRTDIQKFVNHYQTAPRFVNSGHLLVSLLNSLGSSFSRDDMSFVYHARDEGLNIANMLGLTTATNYGRIRANGIFYNKDVKEIIIAHETDFDIEEAKQNWRSLESVKVIHHPFTDLSMQRCNGNYQSEEKGYAVIAINIPMLALQFKQWSIENSEKQLRLRVGHFVSMYVITNMIYTHYDLAYLNRIRHRMQDLPVSKAVKTHPFYITDPTILIDNSIVELMDLFNKRRNFDWYDCAFNTKLISNPNVFGLMHWLDVIPNRQILWAVTVSYLRYWDYFLRATQDSQTNNFFKQKLKLEIRSIRNDKLLDTVLRKEPVIFNEVNDMLAKFWEQV